jgi:hypothetical protein
LPERAQHAEKRRHRRNEDIGRPKEIKERPCREPLAAKDQHRERLEEDRRENGKGRANYRLSAAAKLAERHSGLSPGVAAKLYAETAERLLAEYGPSADVLRTTADERGRPEP